jgi:hypothetical protein
MIYSPGKYKSSVPGRKNIGGVFLLKKDRGAGEVISIGLNRIIMDPPLFHA